MATKCNSKFLIGVEFNRQLNFFYDPVLGMALNSFVLKKYYYNKVNTIPTAPFLEQQ